MVVATRRPSSVLADQATRWRPEGLEVRPAGRDDGIVIATDSRVVQRSGREEQRNRSERHCQQTPSWVPEVPKSGRGAFAPADAVRAHRAGCVGGSAAGRSHREHVPPLGSGQSPVISASRMTAPPCRRTSRRTRSCWRGCTRVVPRSSRAASFRSGSSRASRAGCREQDVGETAAFRVERHDDDSFATAEGGREALGSSETKTRAPASFNSSCMVGVRLVASVSAICRLDQPSQTIPRRLPVAMPNIRPREVFRVIRSQGHCGAPAPGRWPSLERPKDRALAPYMHPTRATRLRSRPAGRP